MAGHVLSWPLVCYGPQPPRNSTRPQHHWVTPRVRRPGRNAGLSVGQKTARCRLLCSERAKGYLSAGPHCPVPHYGRNCLACNVFERLLGQGERLPRGPPIRMVPDVKSPRPAQACCCLEGVRSRGSALQQATPVPHARDLKGKWDLGTPTRLRRSRAEPLY